MTFKNIRIKKKGGGTRTQRVKVLASGKYKFVKNLSKSRTKKSKTRRTKSNPKRRVRRTARRKKGRRRYSMTIPLAPVLGIAQATNAYGAWGDIVSGNYEAALDKITAGLTGFSPASGDWQPQRMVNGVVPIVVGLLVHKFVGGTLGLNRMLGRAKVPFIRL